MSEIPHHDVVICGTGLIQSILASALTRAGKSVLHCDANDYYGQLDAVWTLPFLRSQQSLQQQHAEINIRSFREKSPELYTIDKVGIKVSTPYGVGTVVDITKEGDSKHVKVQLDKWKLANNKHAIVHAVTSQNNSTDIVPLTAVYTRMLLQERARSFALDITPTCIFAAGPAVDGLLKSGVADYLEFKSIEGLYTLKQQQQPKQDITKSASLEKVPCNKSDVFTSSLISPMDKRRLMKLLQLALDYANETTAEALSLSINERVLKQGRSLSRPQNKPLATDELNKLQQHIDANNSCKDGNKTQTTMTFQEYLQKEQKLSPTLQTLVRYALALENQPATSLQTGIANLCRHLQALGRFGTTAFLVPLYGSGELSQAFCRSAAVYGGTYLLRREPVSITRDANNMVTGVDMANEDGTGSQNVSCQHVVAPIESSLAKQTTAKLPTHTVLRQISVVIGKPLKDVNQHRHIVIIPPNSVGDNASPIYGILLDESTNVTPNISSVVSCTLIHWWTVVAGRDTDSIDSGFRALSQAHEILLRDSIDVNVDANGLESEHDEILTTTFTYDHYDISAVDDAEQRGNLHWTVRPVPGLEMDNVFVQAAEIFHRICPDADFLALSTKLEDSIKERLGEAFVTRGDDEDEDQAALASAISIMMSSQNEAKSDVMEQSDTGGSETKKASG